MPEPMRRADARDTILVLSHLRWDFVWQRPQHLLTRAAKDFRVVFIEEPIIEGDVLGVRRRDVDGITVVQPVIPVGAADGDAHELAVVRAEADRATGAVILWFYAPMAASVLDAVAPDVVVFDKMDELSAFAFAPPALREREARIMQAADVVFTGGQAMFEAAQGRHANLHCFPSSIDTAHFRQARARSLPDPADQAPIPRPRIGFFGVVDERLDTGLLARVAALRPDWQFVVLGPVVKVDPATLPQAANLHWLGRKAYTDLPQYLAHWDAGWMPFARNEATRFISPTKTPEFLAAGLPVVSTPITDVVRPYGIDNLVGIATTAEDTVDCLEKALATPDPGWRARVEARLALGSWDRTWAEMRSLIEDELAKIPEKETANV